MFRRRKKVESTGPTFFEIGLRGTAEQFHEANQRAVDNKTKDRSDKAGRFAEYLGAEDQRQLRKGAVQAFREGRHENIQTALLFLEEFGIHDNYVSHEFSRPERNIRENILSDLINKGSDLSVVIDQALLAGVAQDERQAVLDSALFSVIKRKISWGGGVIAALLEAGADANAAVDGYKGQALIEALDCGQPLYVIEMLYKKGASFDDAIDSMKACGWQGANLDIMELLKKKYAHQPAMMELPPELVEKLLRQAENPATGDPVPEDVRQQLRQQIAEMTQPHDQPQPKAAAKEKRAPLRIQRRLV